MKWTDYFIALKQRLIKWVPDYLQQHTRKMASEQGGKQWWARGAWAWRLRKQHRKRSKPFLKLVVLCVPWFYGGSKVLSRSKVSGKGSNVTLTKALGAVSFYRAKPVAEKAVWPGCPLRAKPPSSGPGGCPEGLSGSQARVSGGSRPASPGSCPQGGHRASESP